MAAEDATEALTETAEPGDEAGTLPEPTAPAALAALQNALREATSETEATETIADEPQAAEETSETATADTATDDPVAVEIPLPAGSEFNRPPPEEQAVVPGTDNALALVAPSAPAADVPSTPGGIETSPAPQPDVAIAPAPTAPTAIDSISVTVPDPETAAPASLSPSPVPQPEPDVVATADLATPALPPQPRDVAEAIDPTPAETAVDLAVEDAAPEPPLPTTEEPPSVAEAPAEPASDPVTPLAPAEAGGALTEVETFEQAPQLEVAQNSNPPAVVQLVPPTETAPLSPAPLDDVATPTMDGADPPDTVGTLPAAPRLLRPTTEDDGDASGRTLPQIVSPARNVPEEGDATDDDTMMSDAPEAGIDAEIGLPGDDQANADGDVPALQAFAVPFDATETRPLIAIVLIDEPDDRLAIDTLTQFSFPVAFAIDPSRPDAADRAEAYRAAGFEVLMLASVIPEGATASDTEVALSVARDRVPEAIALMDTPESRVQSDRVVLEAAVGAAASQGQGFVAFPRGLNTAEQMAAREDVPAATLFRLLDDDDQRAPVITRFLGRAEFAAVQEGAVIVAGRTRPDTVTALFSWALGNRNEGVAIAPVSAVLERLGEE